MIEMIMSRTPYRVSFFGGGTDLPSFYLREVGAVISTTIQKYMYVCVNHKFDGRVRLSYSETENVDCVSELKHRLIRETLKFFNIEMHRVELRLFLRGTIPGPHILSISINIV